MNLLGRPRDIREYLCIRLKLYRRIRYKVRGGGYRTLSTWYPSASLRGGKIMDVGMRKGDTNVSIDHMNIVINKEQAAKHPMTQLNHYRRDITVGTECCEIFIKKISLVEVKNKKVIPIGKLPIGNTFGLYGYEIDV